MKCDDDELIAKLVVLCQNRLNIYLYHVSKKIRMDRFQVLTTTDKWSSGKNY